MTAWGFFALLLAIAIGMMVLSVFSTIIAYLLAFVLVGLIGIGLLAAFTRKST